MDKHTLQQYIAVKKEIKCLEQESAEAKAAVLSCKPPDGMPHIKGKISDPTGQAAIRWLKFDNLIASKVEELTKLREEIEAAIATLPANERMLIRLRYIEGYTWEKIAVEMSYSYRQVLRFHGYVMQRMACNVT